MVENRKEGSGIKRMKVEGRLLTSAAAAVRIITVISAQYKFVPRP